jgi:Protein of unknown function (DUF3800)
MAHVLFVDESGQDRRESPYEVLGGIVVEDSRIWPLITALQQTELEYFGRRTTHAEEELKARALLKSKTFRLAKQLEPLPSDERVALAKAALDEGDAAKREGRQSRHTRLQLTALAQAKIAFCQRLIELCGLHQGRAFASIVDRDAPKPKSRDALRKDYAYLFERFFYFLEDLPPFQHGIVVFDELERTASHLLVEQMAKYFRQTKTGRQRSSRILPEPMFVHSDLTSLVQIADLIVYIVSWGVRIKGMGRPARPELDELAGAVTSLRYRTRIENRDGTFERWSFALIDDLRPLNERATNEKRQ